MRSAFKISMSMPDDFARWLRWVGAAMTVALALAGCGGGEAGSPAAVAPARLDQVAAMALARQSVNERMATLPHAVALAAVSPASGTATEDFENGMADWTNWGNAQVVAGVGTGGSKAMQIGPAAGGAALSVTGIVAGTAYRLTVQLRLDDPSQLPQSAYGGTGPFVGVNMLDSAGNKVVIAGQTTWQRGSPTAEGWVQVTMDFVAPQNAATAVIWVWKNDGSAGFMDDVVFGPADAATPPPPPPTSGNMVGNGGFESGMAGWSNWGNAQVVAGAGSSGSNAIQVGTGAGGAAYRVSGLVAGTTYRLTAKLKVSDPSETVWAGFNLLSSSGSFNGGTRSGPVTSTGYVTVTVEWVASAGSPFADVYVWKNGGTGYGSMDDVVFAPVDAAPPPPSNNLITNGGFESGMRDWVNWGNAVEASGQGSSGSWGLRVGAAAGGAGHDVGGIVAGTTYLLTAQARVSAAPEVVYVGVNILDATGAAIAQKSVPITGTAYSTTSLDIVAPANAVKAVVYVWKDAGSGFAYVDDFVFQVADSPAPPPPPPTTNLVANGGFENALASWVNWGNTVASTGQAGAGSYAAQVGTGDGGLGQSIGNVAVGTTYRASARVKVSSAGELGYFGLKFLDAGGNVLGMQYATFVSTTYSTVQVDLAAPANATSALVYVWKNAGSGYAYADEVALAERPSIVPLTVTREQVNPVESGHTYSSPVMARLTTGGYAIAWERATPAGNGTSTWDVCFRRYDATGASSGSAACVAGVRSVIGSPLVGALPGGGFTIAWNESTTDSSDPAGWRWQDYDASGTAQGAIQSGPLPIRLTAMPLVGGNYVRLLDTRQPNNAVTVSFQLYAADGTPIGAAPTVSDTAGYAGDVVGLPDGGFAVTWGEFDPSGTVAMTRSFSADGAPRGGAVAIAPNTKGPIVCSKGGGTCAPWQNLLGITATADGGYIVGWLDGTGIADTGDTFARQFRADGSPASKVVGRIGTGVSGPMMAVGADAFVMAVSDSGSTGISALHVVATPLQ